jgi:hypothetical protein
MSMGRQVHRISGGVIEKGATGEAYERKLSDICQFAMSTVQALPGGAGDHSIVTPTQM